MLTMLVICSRWAVARPIRKAEFANEEISRMVIEEWGKVGVYIKPQKVTHDGGCEFKKRFEDICHLLQTDRHVSTIIGDRPEGHGGIEKFNRDVVQLIAKMCPFTGNLETRRSMELCHSHSSGSPQLNHTQPTVTRISGCHPK